MSRLRKVSAVLAVGLLALSLGACRNEGSPKAGSGTVGSTTTKLEALSVGEMKAGEVGYVESSALRFDAARHGWLNPNFPVREKDSRRVSAMRVERRANGYYVSPPVGRMYVVGAAKSTSEMVPVVALYVSAADADGTQAQTVEVEGKPLAEVQLLPSGMQARSVGAMKYLDAGYVRLSELKFDAARHAQLESTAMVSGSAAPFSARVERRTDGYHVWLPGDQVYFARKVSADTTMVSVAYLHLADKSVVQQLPPSMVKRPINELRVGEAGYFIERALHLGAKEGQGWVNAHTSVLPSRSGPYTMRVERKADGYHVFSRSKGGATSPYLEPSDRDLLVKVDGA